MLQLASSLLFVLLGLGSGLVALLAPISVTTKGYSVRIRKYFPIVITLLASLTVAVASVKYAQNRYEKTKVEEWQHQTVVPKSSGADIGYSPFRDLTSALSLSPPASGIDCSQVRKTGKNTWDITGTIHIGGVTLSRISGVSERVFNIGGNDLASLIRGKCDIMRLEDIH